MKFIEWNENVGTFLAEEDKKQLFLAMLGRPVEGKWEGKIYRKESTRIAYKVPFLELRKKIGEADVLLRFGIRKPDNMPWRAITNPVPKKPVVEMSMNSKAQFDPSDFAELSIVVDEARRVFEAIKK